jgi:hypothetical protein
MKERVYGHDKTIHRTKEVNVEIGPDGNVCAVWFRCAMLPFTQTHVDADRAIDMKRHGVTDPMIAVVFEQGE